MNCIQRAGRPIAAPSVEKIEAKATTQGRLEDYSHALWMWWRLCDVLKHAVLVCWLSRRLGTCQALLVV